jgi:2-amino-4-hydroxy-6-hydroxymethyldihydropteridine diphosphokinase
LAENACDGPFDKRYKPTRNLAGRKNAGLRGSRLEHHLIDFGKRGSAGGRLGGRANGVILVAIGANLPGPDGVAPIATCRAAAASLDALPGLRLRGLSRWYRTAPMPPSGQPDYVNAVAHLTGTTEPDALLVALQALEARAGRVRGMPNAARTLDLDIIAIGALVREAPDPILPHPRAHERRFVLLPLADVAPGWMHPRLAQTIEALITALPDQGVSPV